MLRNGEAYVRRNRCALGRTKGIQAEESAYLEESDSEMSLGNRRSGVIGLRGEESHRKWHRKYR